MKLPAGVIFTDFIAALGRVSVITAAKAKAPIPSLKVPPEGINPKAHDKYWEAFVTKYESVWGRYKKEPERQWACCVAIWVNYCLKRKVQPFDANASTVTQETKERIEDRTENARVSQLNAIDSLLSRGSRKGIVSKFLKETFASIDEPKPGSLVVTSKRIMVLEKGIEFDSKEFRAFMEKSNYQRKAGRYIRPVKTNTDVIVQFDTELNRPVLLLRNTLTAAYAEMLLGIPASKGNRDKVKTGLIKYWKSLIRDLT